MEPITLRASVPFPAGGTPGTLLATWTDEVEKRTDGKVTFELYHDATLIPGAESFSGLASGLADVGFFAASNQPSELPLANWLGQLTVPVTNLGYPMANLAGFPASVGAYATAEPIVEELRGHNIEPMLYMYSSPFMMVCTDPVVTPEDTQGKTIRTGGEPWVSEVEALGMTNVFLPTPELYEALQRGVINCAYLAADNVATLGVTEVTTATALVDGGASSGAQIGFNKDSWDALPSEVQQIMRESAGIAQAAFMEDTFRVYQAAVEAGQAAGHTFTPTEQLNAVIHEQREGLLQELLSSPPAGIDDAEGIRDQYEAYVDEWVAFVESELGIEIVDPATATPEQLIEVYLAGGEDIDWGAYAEQFEAFLTELDH
ncbi:TRAP transporter substrate-binding protein DctP [Agromyces aerolatus]|uniref:TRAP transporter substrate-binding protein DctP n=1 Tax=Agromyces sp. LY-1074 TaxID=3074080 RepID=UPI002861E0CA|nr:MULTISPECIES: TRAP transporter substrate-binding protein DctP [unclassified Agromyces]MDR5699129.1 TRAP transporter substrate-binding protein DctP [Agromyces sp. LY-1074]MDR5705092.1 TRAP transporter substrate-binding protein DctP [Agromyces sp. LY-1358]